MGLRGIGCVGGAVDFDFLGFGYRHYCHALHAPHAKVSDYDEGTYGRGDAEWGLRGVVDGSQEYVGECERVDADGAGVGLYVKNFGKIEVLDRFLDDASDGLFDLICVIHGKLLFLQRL